MAATWIKGLGLAALLAMTASASAQGQKKDGKRPDPDGPRGAGFAGGFGGGGFGGGPGGFGGGASGFPGGGPAEIQRIRAEVKELDAKISRLATQIEEATHKLDRVALANKIADKGGDRGKGPSDFKKFGDGPRFAPDMKKFEGKAKEFGREMGRDFKGPPMRGGPNFTPKGAFERPVGPPPGFGRGPGGFDRGAMNRFGPQPGFGGGVRAFDSRGGPATRGPGNIDDRLERIERTLDEIRRELRSRR